ncbi:MAG: nicotinate phosphoribosyltransferase [Clostridia bacterium]|nr:nicotinate phosphoribosyltransferase [Clostridia bacterium]
MTNIKNSKTFSTQQVLMNAMLLTDGYKLGHHIMYPDGMTKLYSNFTPRANKYFPEADKGVVVFGIQYFIKKYLIEAFNEQFFKQDRTWIELTYKEFLDSFLGENVRKKIGIEHILGLYDLGYLPIEIKALPEGTYCPIGCPVLTITNTHPDFAWLTNYLETLLSTELWMPMTSATTADVFKRELVRHAVKTGFYNPMDMSNLDFLCHDFSMRGMPGVDAAILSGMAHLTSFSGSETVPAVKALEYYYYANSKYETIAGTVPATEHSIECSNATDENGVPDDERYFLSILDKFKTGFISIVADGYDYWHFISKIMPKYKRQIIDRNADGVSRVVVRPDSGDPVKIICGDPDSDDPIVRMGSYEFLWNTFGGTINKMGYKVLDSAIGILYGDSITIKRQKEIYRQLEAKGFAATNLVLGIGSFTYQNRTRDSLGFAMKATYCVVNDIAKEIFKDPKTVVGMPKKSHRGLLIVIQNEKGEYEVTDQVSPEVESSEQNCLQQVFINGKLSRETSLVEIRNNRKYSLKKMFA